MKAILLGLMLIATTGCATQEGRDRAQGLVDNMAKLQRPCVTVEVVQ